MEANNVKEQLKDLATKLVSLEQADFDYAINRYFEANAVFETKSIQIHGASNIKKVALLQSLILATEGQIAEEPRYDENTNIADLTVSRTYTVPKLPAYIPFTHMISEKSTTIHWDTKLHLNADEEGESQDGGEGKKLYVTKFDARARREKVPFEELIPFGLLQPILSLIIILLANVASFLIRHKEESFIALTFSAVHEFIAAVWGYITAESGKRQAQVEKWREIKRDQASALYSHILSTASSLQNDLEQRAKAAGIPVEQYKSQIQSTLDELRAKAAELQTDLEERAQKAGVSVEEYRKQVEEAVRELQRRAQGLGEYFDKKAKEAKEEAEKTSNDKSSDNHSPCGGQSEISENETDDRPRTPQGGLDPTAPGAPTYAEATAQ